ncbi:MAG: hypothetical protein GQ574_28460 [Crocinitomix sp.]|nr:hypothetical protein [Crocinitomix sp.]
MDIGQQLSRETSRRNWDKVIAYVGEDDERFAELIHIFFIGETKSIIGTSQAVGVISEKQPRLIRPYVIDLVAYLKSNPIDAVKRNTMRVFQFIDIPEEIEGDLFDIAMNYLKSLDTAIAIKAFAMTSLRKISAKYPELAQEVIFQIEILVKEEVSKGLTSRGNHELAKLYKLLN